MKSLSRILAVMLFCAPVVPVHAAPVATTNGSNLTSFNPSNANNNQWATMTNGRYDTNNAPSAKTDLGNCNSLILRCAQPKCANGGCAEISVATDIVEFCVKTNDSCKQYHDDLVKFMPSQLVATSNAKINEQNMALQQAKIQADAAANAQSQQQIAAMQQQMQEMQNQMQQEREQNAQQLQQALAQQQAQQQDALNSMKTAATDAAKQTEAGISSYQQEAIARGISADILERQKISGQVITEIENAEVSLKEAKVAMSSSFDYAGCDTRGNNCDGPKRVKKWRELAQGFIDPYNNTIDKIYEALTVAQGVGVDLSDIYMMLNDSCNSWGQYMCEKGANIYYIASDNSNTGAPFSCSGTVSNCYSNDDGSVKTAAQQTECYRKANCRPCTLLKLLTNKDEIYDGWVGTDTAATDNGTVVSCASNALNTSKFFASRARRKNGANLVDIDTLDIWINQSEPKYKSRNYNVQDSIKYCNVNEHTKGVEDLEKAISGRVINTNKTPLCVAEPGKTSVAAGDLADGECSYINPVYAICDTHPYNNGMPNMSKGTSDPDNCTDSAKQWFSASNGAEIVYAKYKDATRTPASCEVKICRGNYRPNSTKNGCEECEKDNSGKCRQDVDANAMADWKKSMTEYNEVQEIVRLKTTVFSQQMFKQYEYLSATLRRLKTQLEKAVVKANLEAAGAKSDSSSSGLLGSSSSNDKEIVLAGAENCWNSNSRDDKYKCLQNNLNLIKSNVQTNKNNAKKQLDKAVELSRSLGIEKIDDCAQYVDEAKKTCKKYYPCHDRTSKDEILQCANHLSMLIADAQDDREDKKNRNRGYYDSRY